MQNFDVTSGNPGGKVEKQNKDSGHFSSAYSLKTKAETIKHYSSWAKTYDQEVAEQNAYAQPARTAEMLQRFLPDTSARLLDAGCGSGLSGIALKKAGYQWIDGCDFSPEMLEIARSKGCYQTLFTADLNEGQPDIAAHTYDAVTCVGVFSFGHVFPGACDDLLRILRPGGLLIIALNEQYWQNGDLEKKLDTLVAAGQIKILSKEFGDHLPGHNVNGWVIALEKLS